mgnify:CR=1 FL=1
MKGVVSELVSRIEGYESKFEVVSIFKNEDGNYCVEIKVKEEKSDSNNDTGQ